MKYEDHIKILAEKIEEKNKNPFLVPKKEKKKTA